MKSLVQQTVMAIITEDVLTLGGLFLLLHKNDRHQKLTGQLCILNTSSDMRTGRESGGKELFVWGTSLDSGLRAAHYRGQMEKKARQIEQKFYCCG